MKRDWIKPSILVVALINILFMIISGITYPVIPLYLVGTEVGVLLTSIVVTLSSLVGFVFQIVWGNISDRVNKRREFIILGGFIMSLCYFSAAIYSNNILLMCTLYILAGIGGAAVFTPSSALMADICSRENIGRAMGLFWAGGSLGWALPLVFAGTLLEKYGVKSIFLISGLISLCIGIIGIAMRKVDVSRDRISSDVKPVPWAVVIRPRFLLLYLATLVFYLGDVVKNIYVPQFHAYELKLGEASATAILSTASWAEIPLLLLFGFLVDRMGSWTIFNFSLLASAIYMMANVFVSNIITAVIVMVFYGVVWASFSSSSSAIAVELSNEDEKGTALGMINANFSLANIVGPPLFGYIVKRLGYRVCFASMAVMLTSVAITTAIAIKQRIK